MTPVKARAAKILDDILTQLAKEESISERKINCIIQAVFGQIAEDIRGTSLRGTHVKHLGKFKVKSYNINRFLDQGKDGCNTKTKESSL